MPQRILVPLIVACAVFMEHLDSTVIATALPAIAADFNTSPIQLKLALTSYLLAIAIFIPASGWLADRYGSRLIFRSAIAIFTFGSILCGFSNSIAMLVTARIIQGIGGAMMAPVGRLVILRTVSKRELIGSLAWLTFPAMIGPVIGPPVGGFITTYFDWPWIFWINIPVGIIGFILATIFIPDVRIANPARFDRIGFVLTVIGLSTFMAGSTTVGLGIIPLPVVLTLLGIGTVLIVTYVFYSRRQADPILDLTLLQLSTFRQSVIGATLIRFGLGATPFLLPLLLQVGFGFTPFESGTITFASAAGSMAMKFAAPPILRIFGFRNVLLWNTMITAFFVAIPAFFTPATPITLMMTLLLIGGFFRSLQFTSINALAYAEVPPEVMSRATTLASVAQQLALSAGISIGAMVLEATVYVTGEALTWASFWPAFATIGILSAFSIFSFWRLTPDAGDEMSGHRRPKTDAED